jgi:hypothetical protein
MAEGLTITDEQRGALPPEILSVVDEYDQRYGPGNAVSHSFITSYYEDLQQQQQTPVATQPVSEDMAPDAPPRPIGTTQLDIDVAQGDAYTTRRNEIFQSEDVTWQEAGERASAEVQAKMDEFAAGTTVANRHVSGSTEQDIRDADSAVGAFVKSLGPQNVRVGTQQQLNEIGFSDQEVDALRDRVIVESKVKARQIARDRGLEENSEEFNQVADQEFPKIAANELRLLYRDFYKQSKKDVLRENNLDPEGDYPADMKDELLVEARSRATQAYDFITPLAFEDLGQVLGPNGVPLVPDAAPGAIRRAMSRVQKDEASIWTQAGLGLYSQWHNFDPGSGEVAESWLGAAIRDVALIPRAVTYPVLRAVTWDMDPVTGKPINPDDPMYRISQFFDSVIPESMQDALKLIQSGSIVGNLLPVGQGYELDRNANTGHWLRDLALSHARGEMMSSDWSNLTGIQAMQQKGLLPHWWEHTALGLEVFMPGKIFAAPFKAGTYTLGRTSEGLSNIARAAKADDVAEVFDAVRTWSNSSESLGEALTLRRLQRQVYDEAGIPLSRPATIRGAVEAPEKIADQMAADLAAKMMTVDKADDLRRTFAGIKEGSFLDEVVNESFSTLMDFRRLQSVAKNPKMFSNMVKELSKYKRGRELLAEMKIAKGMKTLYPKLPDKVLAHNVMTGVMKNPIRRFTAEHIPDNFVFAGDSTLIVRKPVWQANQNRINKALKKKLDADVLLKRGAGARKDEVFRFKNGKEVANLATEGFKRSAFSPVVLKTLDKVRNNQAITRSEYNIVHSLASNKIILDELPITAFAVRDGTQLLSRKAAELGQGRNLAVAQYAQRAIKGTRAFFGGQSDYAALVANPGKRGALWSRPKTDMFGKTPDPALIEFQEQTIKTLNDTAKRAETMILEAQKSSDPVAGMNSVLNRVSSGDNIQDYSNILNIFFAVKQPGALDAYFGGNGELQAALRQAGLAKKPLTIETMKEAIEVVRRSTGRAVDLEKSAIKRQTFYGRLTGDDDLSALLSAYVVNNVSEEVYKQAVRNFENLYPSLLVKVPTRADESARIELFKNIAKNNDIPEELADELSKIAGRAFKTSDADRRTIATAIMRDLFTRGGLATQDDLQRMYNAATGTVAGIVMTKTTQASIKDLRDAIKGFVAKNPDGPTLTELEKIIVPAYVKSVAGIDMNDVRGVFSGLGTKSTAGDRSLRGLAYPSKPFGENGVMMFDSRMREFADKMASPDFRGKIEKQLSMLREQDRILGSSLLSLWNTTRKTTVTGVLGGSIIPGTRFIGVNALTNSIIGAITVPGYALNIALKTPSTLAQGFVRAFRRAGGISGPGAYDPLRMMYTGNEGDIAFRSATGKIWTKGAFEEAVEKNALRFSQATFEFGSDTLQGAIRASRLGPGGKPIQAMLRVPGTSGVNRTRYWEFLRPDRKTIWTSVSEEFDNAQRMAVFANALKVGMKQSDAAALARASLLDYASLNNKAAETMSRNMAFFAFRYNMAMETLRAFARDGRALNNMAGTLNWVNGQRRDMEEWVLEPDWMKTRLWKDYKGKFREWVAGSLGPDAPFAEPFTGISNIIGLVMDSRYRDSFGIGEIVKESGKFLLSDPRLGALFDVTTLDGRSGAPSGYMPPQYLAAAAAFGMQDEFISLFELEQVPNADVRQDIALVNGKQYRFKGEEANAMFRMFQVGALMLGQKRAIEDVPRILAGMGIGPDSVEWRKEGLGGPLFGFGGTVGSYRDPIAAVDRIERQLERELLELSRRPTTGPLTRRAR